MTNRETQSFLSTNPIPIPIPIPIPKKGSKERERACVEDI